MRNLNHLSEVFHSYDTYVIDLWGVMHNGIALNPKAIEVVENLNRKKSEILYSEIDSDDVFSGFANVDDRSIMNVTFNLNDEKHKDIFDKMLIENNISGLNGHRSVGGYRASIYNAMDISSVEILIDTIKKFKNYI